MYKRQVFSIAFRTPPADDTGVAHILEHSVLCGSDKFPSKDPFIAVSYTHLDVYKRQERRICPFSATPL